MLLLVYIIICMLPVERSQRKENSAVIVGIVRRMVLGSLQLLYRLCELQECPVVVTT